MCSIVPRNVANRRGEHGITCVGCRCRWCGWRTILVGLVLLLVLAPLIPICTVCDEMVNCCGVQVILGNVAGEAAGVAMCSGCCVCRLHRSQDLAVLIHLEEGHLDVME